MRRGTVSSFFVDKGPGVDNGNIAVVLDTDVIPTAVVSNDDDAAVVLDDSAIENDRIVHDDETAAVMKNEDLDDDFHDEHFLTNLS